MSSDLEIATSVVSGPSLNVSQFMETDGEWNKKHYQRCQRHCCRLGRTWLTSAVGISVILILYLTMGAIMFMFLAGSHVNRNRRILKSSPSPSSSSAPAFSSSLPSSDEPLSAYDPDGRLLAKTLETVERLWSITEDLNILYRDNWTHLAQLELRHYQDQLIRTLRKTMMEERYSFRMSWTFPMAFLYSLTLVTTIGYGFYTPSSILSRCLTIAYSIIGIPLFLLYLSIVGERVARVINNLTCCMCCCYKKSSAGRHHPSFHYRDIAIPLQQVNRNEIPNGHSIQLESPYGLTDAMRKPHMKCSCCYQVPLFISVVCILFYVTLGSFLLSLLENLTFLEGLYLSFNLLLTLGFATLVPGMNAEADHSMKTMSQVSLIVITFYILMGMTLLASSFNVILESKALTKPTSPSSSSYTQASRLTSSKTT